KGLDAAYRERLHPRRWRRRWCSATPGAIKVGLIVWGRWRISGGCKWVSARRDRWISCLPCWPGRQVWSAWTWLRRRWRCRARLQLFQFILCLVELLLEACQLLTEREQFTLRELPGHEHIHRFIDQATTLHIYLASQAID